MSDAPRMGRGERARQALLLFGLYFVVLFARGHGVGTVGLMLFFPEFPLPRMTGWTGTALLALALLPESMRAYRIVTLGAILLLGCSILLASADTDLSLLTWLFSAPFGAAAWFWMLKVGWRRAPEGHE